MKIQIDLGEKKFNFLKKKLNGEENIKLTFEKILDDWIANLVNFHYEKNKTTEDKLNDLTT